MSTQLPADAHQRQVALRLLALEDPVRRRRPFLPRHAARAEAPNEVPGSSIATS
jgi:hypothetical protein